MSYPNYSFTNRERVGKAIDLLKAGLAPVVSREFVKYYDHKGRPYQALKRILNRPIRDRQDPFQELDTAALLAVMEKAWNHVFRNTLGKVEQSLVLELQEVRNGWAHQKPFSDGDTFRALDSAYRLLKAISSPYAGEIEKLFPRGGLEPVEVPSDDGDRVVEVPISAYTGSTLVSRTEQCFQVLRCKLHDAESSGASYIDVRAGDLHKEVWGPDSYPSPSHRMPTVCNAMEKLKQDNDEYLSQPPSGKGANLRIRYLLPRGSHAALR